MLNVSGIQASLSQAGLDGWLFYDFRRQNPTAWEVLGISGVMLTRRFFYWIPARGEPALLVHAIEDGSFPPLPGARRTYAGYESLRTTVGDWMRGTKRIAMEYCSEGAIPYSSRVDAGTIEWIRTLGPEVVSSADLVQRFACVWSPEQLEGHCKAAKILDAVKDAAFDFVRRAHRGGRDPLETEIQSFMAAEFDRHQFAADHPPIVAVNEHAGDPHYTPSPEKAKPMRKGDLLLLDLWGKLSPLDRPDAGSADITWVGIAGEPSPEIQKVFEIVIGARDAAIEAIRAARSAGTRIEGWQADRAARDVVAKAGYGERFFHRTGHSIGVLSIHGDGANLDDFETHDTRELMVGTCFSVEPGIYLESFGIRSETDVYLAADGPKIFGPLQKELVRI